MGTRRCWFAPVLALILFTLPVGLTGQQDTIRSDHPRTEPAAVSSGSAIDCAAPLLERTYFHWRYQRAHPDNEYQLRERESVIRIEGGVRWYSADRERWVEYINRPVTIIWDYPDCPDVAPVELPRHTPAEITRG